MTDRLNARAHELACQVIQHADDLRATCHDLPGGGRIVDCGVKAEGSIAAGLALARICLSGLAEVTIVPGEIGGLSWPHVQVSTDSPVAACLASQYAGWQISVEKYFAMGSGPMRAAAAAEELFKRLEYRETPQCTVGVLETSDLPDDSVMKSIAAKTKVPPEQTILLAARTSSQAGNLQVLARSVETALHKLFELGFDVRRVRSGYGIAPLAPVAADDLTGIGRTNDAILYGGRVTLWVQGDDESVADVGPKVPSVASDAYGKPFLEIFEEAGRDFYQIDPHLFSPAEIVFHNLDSGTVHRFGNTASEILRKSFGLG